MSKDKPKYQIRIKRDVCEWMANHAKQEVDKKTNEEKNSSLLPNGYIEDFHQQLVKMEGTLNLKYAAGVCYNEKRRANVPWLTVRAVCLLCQQVAKLNKSKHSCSYRIVINKNPAVERPNDKLHDGIAEVYHDDHEHTKHRASSMRWRADDSAVIVIGGGNATTSDQMLSEDFNEPPLGRPQSKQCKRACSPSLHHDSDDELDESVEVLPKPSKLQGEKRLKVRIAPNLRLFNILTLTQH